MGLLDFGAKVVLSYKADISDAKAKIRELSGEEKKLAQERLAAEEKANKGIERQVKAMGMLAAGIAATIGAVALARVGLDAYAKTSEHAAKKVTEIKTSASTAMDSVQASIGKTVVAMEPLISSVASLVKLLGDAGAAGPLAMSALAMAVTGNPIIAGIVLGSTSGGTIKSFFNDVTTREARVKAGAAGVLSAAQRFDPNPVTWKDTGDRIAGAIESAVKRGLGVDSWSGGIQYKSGGKGKARPGKWSDVAGQPIIDWTDYGPTGGGSLGAKADDKARDMYGREEDLSAQIAANHKERMDEIAASARELAAINDGGPTVMERLLGSHDEFALYATAFQGFSDTIQGTFDAIVTGSEPAGAALKRLAATGVMSIAKEMLAGSIHYGAKAVGAAASYNYVQAGWYATTAAKYAAGAVAVGAIASQLGGGGSVGSAGGSGARPSAPYTPSRGGDDGGQQVRDVFLVGEQFGYQSPRQQQKNAKRITSLAYGSRAVRYG